MSAQPHPHHLLARIAVLEDKLNLMVSQTEFDLLQVKVQENQLLCEKRHLHVNPSDKESEVSFELRNDVLEARIKELTQKLVDEEKCSKELEVKYRTEKEKRAFFEQKLENSEEMYRKLEERFKDLEMKYKQMEGQIVHEESASCCSQLDLISDKDSVLGATSPAVQKVDATKLNVEFVNTTQDIASKDEQLFTYSKNGNNAEVKSIIASGANVNAVDDKDKTPLHYAAKHGHVSVVTHLVLMGAHVHARDDSNNTPFHEACSNSQHRVAQILVTHGASVRSRNLEKRTPLHCAAIVGSASICTLLLDHGAKVNSCDCNLATPLILASWSGHVSIVELLIKRGANLDATDFNKRTALHQAVFRGFRHVCEKLLEASAPIDATDVNLNTPLHSAVMKGYFDIVKLLVRHGADTEICGGKSFLTPKELAERFGRTEIMEWLH